MKIIAHRGNLNGPDPATENTIAQLLRAINEGFEIELDTWYHKGGIYIGHDGPKNKISYTQLLELTESGWIHWKNEAIIDFFAFAVGGFVPVSNQRYFCHDKEPFTKTLNGCYWLYPGTPITDDMLSAPAIVACLPELAPEWDISRATHICTDYPFKYREKYL